MKTTRLKLLSLIALMVFSFLLSCDKEEGSIIGVLDSKIANIESEQDGYEIKIINQVTSLSESIIDDLVSTFHDAYPKLIEKYNPEAPVSVRVIIDATYTGVAFTSNGSITISGAWLNDNPDGTDVLVRELMHIVQGDTSGVPLWLTDGIADYVRNEFGVNPGGWSLPAYDDSQHYTDDSGVTASFLVWIESEYDSEFVIKINEKICDGDYFLGLWLEYTGFSLNNLWLIYSGNYIEGGDIDRTDVASIKVSKENSEGPDADEGSLKLIDGDTNSKFLIFDYPTDFWMQQDLPQAELVDTYTLTSGNDASGRDPKDWKLVGSNDEVTWVDLDTRSDEIFAGRNETKEYSFTSTTSYKYYRLFITANNGDTLFQLSEWRLFEAVEEVTDLTDLLLAITVSKENPDGPDGGEGSSKVVDGDTESKFLVFDFPTDFWMQQEFSQEEVINKYTLTSGNDASGRDPKDWTLSGSNDEATWVDLDTRSDEIFAARNETKEYTFTSTTPYKYYRLFITANNGDTLFQLSEWRLLRVEE